MLHVERSSQSRLRLKPRNIEIGGRGGIRKKGNLKFQNLVQTIFLWNIYSVHSRTFLVQKLSRCPQHRTRNPVRLAAWKNDGGPRLGKFAVVAVAMHARCQPFGARFPQFQKKEACLHAWETRSDLGRGLCHWTVLCRVRACSVALATQDNQY